MIFLSAGNMYASDDNAMQYVETRANWTIVSVAGLSNEVKMDFDEVFVNADDQYHTTHSTWEHISTSLDRALPKR